MDEANQRFWARKQYALGENGAKVLFMRSKFAVNLHFKHEYCKRCAPLSIDRSAVVYTV